MQKVEKFTANSRLATDVSGDATTAKVVQWHDFADSKNFFASVQLRALVGTGCTVAKIVCNTQSDGGGAQADLLDLFTGETPPLGTVGHRVVGEVLAAQLDQKAAEDGQAYRYVGVQVQCNNAGDDVIITQILQGLRYAAEGETANVTS